MATREADVKRAIVIVAAMTAVVMGVGLRAQTPADAASRLSGTWTINRELSPGFRAPGARPGGPGGRGGGMAARLTMAGGAPMQRRGGGGGDTPTSMSDLSPEEVAAMVAMRQLQQLADEITIAATADKVSFTDVRGERTYTIDGKNARMAVGETNVTTKSKWDKNALKQEFSTASTKLSQTWEVNAEGRLVLTAKVESLRLRTPEQKAVFDKK
jgi:hypothetical protein